MTDPTFNLKVAKVNKINLKVNNIIYWTKLENAEFDDRFGKYILKKRVKEKLCFMPWMICLKQEYEQLVAKE